MHFTVGAAGGRELPQNHPSPQPTFSGDMGGTLPQAAQPQEASKPAASSSLSLPSRKLEPTAVEVERYLRTRGMGSFDLKPEIALWRQTVSRSMRTTVQSQSRADLFVAPCMTGMKERTARYAYDQAPAIPTPTSTSTCIEYSPCTSCLQRMLSTTGISSETGKSARARRRRSAGTPRAQPSWLQQRAWGR